MKHRGFFMVVKLQESKEFFNTKSHFEGFLTSDFTVLDILKGKNIHYIYKYIYVGSTENCWC